MLTNLPDLRPACSRPGHGFMTLRPFDRQTYEQLWTGPWYDCTHIENGQRCGSSSTSMSDAMKAYAESTKRRT
jgi:hypothetical protein